jgi:hypothetical protein
MSFNYLPLAQVALDQIANFGRDCVLGRVTESSYNFDTGANSGGSTAEETIKAVVTDFTDKEIDGVIVQRGDRLYTIAAKDLTAPVLNDYLDDWKILNVQTIKTGDTALLYKCQVRK